MIFRKFLNGNEWYWRLLRTIIQGLLGVLAANIDLIIEPLQIDPTLKALIVAATMAILSPIMAELGRGAEVMAAKRAMKQAIKDREKLVEESTHQEEKE